jgi:hypothetical protein
MTHAIMSHNCLPPANQANHATDQIEIDCTPTVAMPRKKEQESASLVSEWSIGPAADLAELDTRLATLMAAITTAIS